MLKRPSFSKIKFSYKLIGGNQFVITSDQENAVDIIKKRLDANKIYDYSISKDGNQITLITTAGDDIIPIIEAKGDFYAKVGDKLFFDTKDIQSVCTTGTNCVINLYAARNQTQTEITVVWKYGFEVELTKEAGNKFINLTEGLNISSCQMEKCLLSAKIDYYIDDKLIGSEDIYSENKGLAYEKPIIGGDVGTQEDATKMLYFAQSMLYGKLDAKVDSFTPAENNKVASFDIIVYVMIGFAIASAIASAILIKKLKIFITALLLGLSEIVIAIGSIVGLNFMITFSTLASFIAVGIMIFVYQNYIAYRIKKEGIIKSKILTLSKSMDTWLIVSLVILFILVFVYPSFIAALLIHLTTFFLLTKSMLLKAIETA